MSDAEKTILSQYQHFFDGQFIHEGIQEALAQKYSDEKKIASNFFRQEDQGFADLRMLDWDSTFFNTKASRLVHLHFNGSDTGESLWRHCEDWLKANKVKHLTSRVSVENDQAINFLMGKGFELLGGKYLTRIDLKKSQKKTTDERLLFSQASEKDTADLVGLAKGNFKENRFFRDDFFEDQKAGQVYESWIVNRLKQKPEEVIKASIDGEVIGFAMTSRLEPVPGKSFGFVELIAVDPSQAGQGFGKRITRYVLKQMQESGIQVVFANVVNSNISSLKMFQGVGFSVYATLLEFRKLIE